MRPNGSVNYRQYLKSDRWAFTAEAAKRRADYRCQVCNSADDTLEAHHRTYDRLGDERDEDITVLCRACHRLFHRNKRGELRFSAQDWMAELRKQRPSFYAAVAAQADYASFNGDTCFLVYGAQAPAVILEQAKELGAFGGFRIEAVRLTYQTAEVPSPSDAKRIMREYLERIGVEPSGEMIKRLHAEATQ